MKEEILRLRGEGKTYSQITLVLNCSKSTVAYYCNNTTKEKSRIKTQKRRAISTGLARKLDTFLARRPRNKTLTFATKRKAIDFQRRDPLVTGYTAKYSRELSYAQLEEKLENSTCYLTGVLIDLTDSSSFSLDHIVPVSRGGSNTIDNLGLCHSKVNAVKSDLLVEELFDVCIKILEFNGYEVKKKLN